MPQFTKSRQRIHIKSGLIIDLSGLNYSAPPSCHHHGHTFSSGCLCTGEVMTTQVT